MKSIVLLRISTKPLLASLAVCALAFQAGAARKVELPAGSDQADFAAAIAQAGPGGAVLVKAGLHEVQSTVVIDIPVKIMGEPGAEIVAGTGPAPNWVFLGGPPSPVTPTLHILNTERVEVRGLRFTAGLGVANCAVVVENSPRVEILENQIESFQSGILVHYGDEVLIRGNRVAVAPLWADPNPLALAWYSGVTQGIEVINGRSAKIVDNRVTGASFGIFVNDHGGQMLGNIAVGCATGYILCHQAPLYLISGVPAAAAHASNFWHVQNNTAFSNYSVGFLVIDGSHDNLLVNNAAWQNCNAVTGLCRDIELVGETDYYGINWIMPASHDNTLVIGSHQEIIVKDCGDNNVIHGSYISADPNLDPCP